MAAIESPGVSIYAALTAAAAALPLITLPVEAGQIETVSGGVSALSYRELEGRMTVAAPMVWVHAPLATDLDVDARIVYDSLSGASPQYVSNQGGKIMHTLSSASIRELRREGSLRLARWHGDDQLALTLNSSSEHDYLSRAIQLESRIELLDRQLTLDLGLGRSADEISATGNSAISGTRRTINAFIGLTKALGPTDIVQGNIAYSSGDGYFDDPYKFTLSFATPTSRLPVIHIDRRPDGRQSVAWLTRWRHYVVPAQAALSVDYRYYRDSWAIRAHMLETGWHQTLTPQWSIKPMLRWYRQSAAEFYATTILSRTGVGSSDARLGPLRARTVGLAVTAATPNSGNFELFAGRYLQRMREDAGANNTDQSGLDADFVSLGWSRSF